LKKRGYAKKRPQHLNTRAKPGNGYQKMKKWSSRMKGFFNGRRRGGSARRSPRQNLCGRTLAPGKQRPKKPSDLRWSREQGPINLLEVRRTREGTEPRSEMVLTIRKSDRAHVQEMQGEQVPKSCFSTLKKIFPLRYLPALMSSAGRTVEAAFKGGSRGHETTERSKGLRVKY